MEKKRKEKGRSGKINPNNPANSSSTTNIQNDKKNGNKANSKNLLVQQIDIKNNDDNDIQMNTNIKSTMPQNSRKQTKNLSKQKPKNKNNLLQKSKSSPNNTLSPTNIISRSRNNRSYQNFQLNFNEKNDIDENFKDNNNYNYLNQSNSLDFSPIQKREIKMSPPPAPYNENSDYDIEKNLQNELDMSGDFDEKNDSDSNHQGNNGSFTQLFTSKCDLKAELQAAIQVNKQLKQRDAQLQKRIQDLNRQSQLALQVLEDRLTELRDENIQLTELLEQLPSEERLIIEYNKLTTFPIEENDIEPLINIGILEEGENISVLKGRLDDMIYELRYYESLYDIVAQYGEDGFLTKFFLSYFDDSYSKSKISKVSDGNSTEQNDEKLAKELKHKIDLLEKSSDSSFKMARKKLARLEKEIELLRKDVQDKQNISNYQNSESSSILLNQSGVFSFQDIANVLVTAGGNKRNLTQIDGNTFIYKPGDKNEKSKEVKFKVESICGRPYALSSNSSKKVPLFSFFKSNA